MVDMQHWPVLLLLYVKYTVRFALILFTNIYAISSYCVWMLALWPMRIILPCFYWKLEAVLFKGLLAMVVTWFYIAGYTVEESGDDLRPLYESEALLLSNHQSTGDVPTLMASLQGRQMIGGTLFWIMDELFRFTHFGAVSAIRRDFFIKQGKSTRHEQLEQLSRHLKSDYITLNRRWIVLFPEGGFLYKRMESNKIYAEKNDLPVWKYLTLPRIGAVKVILDSLATDSYSAMKEDRIISATSTSAVYDTAPLQWIIDVTIAYPEGNPLTLGSIGCGSRGDCKVSLHYRAYPVSEVPVDSEGLTQWLYDRFAEKEIMLEEFYCHGTPLAYSDQHKRLLPRKKTGPYQFDCLHVVLFHVFYLVSFYMHVTYLWKPLFSLLSCLF